MPIVHAAKETERQEVIERLRRQQAAVDAAKETEHQEVIERIRREVLSGQLTLVPLSDTERREIIERLCCQQARKEE